MKIIKQLVRPDRLRLVPEQFSWIDQALVQRHLIDHCKPRAAALYLFLLTVADAQGLSYYSAPTLAKRLQLRTDELDAARRQLIELDLIAYQAPLYQVLAIQGTTPALRTPSSTAPPPLSVSPNTDGPVSLAQLLQQMERRRARL